MLAAALFTTQVARLFYVCRTETGLTHQNSGHGWLMERVFGAILI